VNPNLTQLNPTAAWLTNPTKPKVLWKEIFMAAFVWLEMCVFEGTKKGKVDFKRVVVFE